MKKKLSTQSKKSISILSALLFLMAQANLSYAAEAFSFLHPTNLIPSNSINTPVHNPLANQIVKHAKNFSVADYDVQTGALNSVKQFEVSRTFSNTTDYRLISEMFFNSQEQIHYILNYGTTGVSERYDFNYRPDGALRRIDMRTSDDVSTNVESATYFRGAKGMEQPAYYVDFDDDGSVLAVHSLSFDKQTGALNRVDRKSDVWSDVPMDTSFFLTGKLGEEMPAFALTYDAKGQVNGFQDFGFHASGALADSSSDGTHQVMATPPSAGKNSFDVDIQTALNSIPVVDSKIGKNSFGFDLQGILTNIDVRAGPLSEAISLWKGAN